MKNVFVKTVILGATLVAVSGCSSRPKPLYNYENYSESYYDYKKNLDAKSEQALQKSIVEAINNADESRSGRVAPGLYANLGYIYLKEGKATQAIENFKKEKQTYPESGYFMDRMIHKVRTTEEKK
jgi:hypothetical protein